MPKIIYDVFISHAFEDKNDFSNQLAFALKKKGLKVWYSGFELQVGDSIAESVNTILQRTKYAVVIISPVYLRKIWAMNELRALFAAETKKKRILPILHEISVGEILKHLPLLGDRYTISSEKEMSFIVNRIFQAIKGAGKYARKKTIAQPAKKKRKTGKTKERSITNSGFITLGGNMTIKGENIAGGDIHIRSRKKTR